ncbi:MAG: YCF48-related protein [Saprospiraceae bacterium]
MKTVLAFTLLLITSSIQAQSSWSILPNTPYDQGSRIEDVFFRDSLLGWCASAHGRIYHTADGGDSWALQFSNNFYFRSIEFLTDQIGIAGTLDQALMRTTDGGENWVNIANQIDPVPPAICGLHARDSQNIYAVGSWYGPAFLMHSSDAGENWTVTDMSAYAEGLVDVYFVTADTGYVCGKGFTGGVILKTTDGGQNWTEQISTGTAGDYAWKIQRVTSDVWVSSIQTWASPGKLLRSEDNGSSWVALPTPLSQTQGIGFANPDTGWIGGYQAGWYKTINGGQNWEFELFGGNFNRFYFLNADFGYASGARIYKYQFNPSSATPTPPAAFTSPFDFTLSPNPTRESTSIRFELDQTDNVYIGLYTPSGQQIRRIFQGRLPQGEHNMPIQLENLTPGNYMVGMQRNHGMVSKTLVVH